MKITDLQTRYESRKITRATFNLKKKRIEERIRAINSRLRVLRGGIAREKRHEEEKAEIKRKKKEEKQVKKRRIK